MENNKLKKLGKYFTKGLQAGVLATALVTGMTGCPTPASDNGGYEIDDNQQGGNNQGGNGNEQGGNNQGGNGNEQGGNEWQQPSYYINDELGGQHFTDPNAVWHNADGLLSDCHKNAVKFISNKVTELRNDINGQTNITLYQEIDDALKKMNMSENEGDIYANITNNYTALAPFFAKNIENTQSVSQVFNNDTKEYNAYKCSYYKLADIAYKKSLADHREDYSDQYPANMDMRESSDAFFYKQLAYTNYTYTSFDAETAKQTMKNTLEQVAYLNNVEYDVLKKFVELALYNESLYGLHDLTTNQNLRRASSFDVFIKAERENTNAQSYSIDDRTM